MSRAHTGHGSQRVVLALPFQGLWLAQNSPARRVPSHGSELFGERYAIDFIGVDEWRRTAARRDWRTLLATERPERFVAFGRPILAPAPGRVVAVHDGEVDHEARRSQFALATYGLTQPARLRQGVAAIAGNFVILEVATQMAYVAMVHLKARSIRVRPGDTVSTGQQIAACGNSGNSTQPHLHIQAMDSPDVSVARGIPMLFRTFRERPRHSRRFEARRNAIPGEGSVIAPLTHESSFEAH